ncbi:uncharacterized protein LOC132558330 [Ylistrum balloti]|uniref:uncharacterized protein LOC132558330 n=1 Tax=Ylistrum balloti TaxID=509963 RepID=UPI0029059D5D|nr:uncharacterized protein LOC132558330 [Ylistrum balloti]
MLTVSSTVWCLVDLSSEQLWKPTMMLSLVLLVAFATLTIVSTHPDTSDDTCPYGWFVHVHSYKINEIDYVTEKQLNGDFARFKMVADIEAYKFLFVRGQLWALEDIEPAPKEPITLRSTCKTKSELLYGFWESSATFCYIVLPGLQNVRRAKCDNDAACCGPTTVCYEDGWARYRYWVYCAHFTSPFNGYFYLRYDTFPQCCTCRRCDKCLSMH